VAAVTVFAAVSLLTVVLWPIAIYRSSCASGGTANACSVGQTILYWSAWGVVLVAAILVSIAMYYRPGQGKHRILAGLGCVWWLFVASPIVYSDGRTFALSLGGLPSAIALTFVWWLGGRLMRGK
jgi:hypothetical protein